MDFNLKQLRINKEYREHLSVSYMMSGLLNHSTLRNEILKN
jgi:hypothetical protein